MKLFAKNISTVKADPLATFREFISAAIKTAREARVPLGEIAHELRSRGALFQRMIDDAIERRMNNPHPLMHDALTLKPIDSHAEAARREERLAAEDLRRQQEAYRKTVNERAERENFLRR